MTIGASPATPAYREKRHYRLLIALLVVGIAVSLGFLVGRRCGQITWESDLGTVPNWQDYRQMATLNGYSVVRADGPSMQPTLARWNYVLVRRTHQIRRYDILDSGHHGMHRVLGLPGETLWLVGGRVRVCTPHPPGPPNCRLLTEPYVRYHAPAANIGPVAAGDGYVTVPDNRSCCHFLIAVPIEDAVGVVEGSLISYGPLGPAGRAWPSRPELPALRYDRGARASETIRRRAERGSLA